jgi:hypothetical protein
VAIARSRIRQFATIDVAMSEKDTVANHGAKLELACRCPTGLIRQRDADSALEQMRFERSVPAAEDAFEIVLFSYSRVPVPARKNSFTERDRKFESHLLQRRVMHDSPPSGAIPQAASAWAEAPCRSSGMFSL